MMNEYNVYAHQEANRLELALKAESARAQRAARALAATAPRQPSLLARVGALLGRTVGRRPAVASDGSDPARQPLERGSADADVRAPVAVPEVDLPPLRGGHLARAAAGETIVIDATDHALAGVIFSRAREHRRRSSRRGRSTTARTRARLAGES